MKSKDVKNILRVTQKTLNNYIKNGTLRFIKINDYHYNYNEDDVYRLLGRNKERINVTYSRVSLNKQKNDLESQTKRLYDFSISNGYKIDKQYIDIKSGMNFNDRKQFNILLNDIIEYKIDNIIIENKDRLCRFGFDLFETICSKYNTKIIVTSDIIDKTYEQELTEDLISIIHYFSMKSYSNRRKLNKIKKELETEDDN